MGISLFLSTIIFQTSVAELEQGARRPIPQFEIRAGQLLPSNFREALIAERAQQLAEAKEAIRNRLIVLNIIIMFGSGILSYILAARTLRPIEAAHEALERFTADASHELRTPITVMQTETEVALLDPQLDLATAKTQLQSNITELGRLTELTAGLLRLARSGIEPKAYSSVSVRELVTEARSLIERNATAKNITIALQKLSPLSTQGDRLALVDALVILLDNAVKYSPNGSTVTISSHKEQNRILIEITDTGIGIKKSDLPHIFERFYRADSSRTNDGPIAGYGLGLAIAENIIIMHGGDIRVHSKIGKGSTFTLSLPVG